MFRDGLRGAKPLAVALAAVLSLVAAWMAVRSATHSGPDLSIPGGSGGGNASAAAPPRSTKTPTARSSTKTGPKVLPGKRTSANGHQLWARAPLNKIKQDQGASVTLPDGHTMWIFADTFQRAKDVRRGDPSFFNTSAVGVTNPGSWQLHYATAPRSGRAVEFLPRTQAELADRRAGANYEAVWPTGVTTLPDGRIIIAYAKYRVQLNTGNFDFLGAGLFEYRYRSLRALLHGAQATRIASDIWNPLDGEVRSPLYADGYVYFSQCQNLQCYALRTTPDELANRSSYRWWTGSDWSKDALRRTNVTVVTNHPGGNASIVRLKSGVYAMADTEAGSVSQYGQLWVAPNPWGPWSRAASFLFPRCPAGGCYGLNLHPDQSTSSLLRVSYSTTGGPYVRVYDVPVEISSDGSSVRVR